VTAAIAGYIDLLSHHQSSTLMAALLSSDTYQGHSSGYCRNCRAANQVHCPSAIYQVADVALLMILAVAGGWQLHTYR